MSAGAPLLSKTGIALRKKGPFLRFHDLRVESCLSQSIHDHTSDIGLVTK
jgi:hypothetical protein